jgi:Fe2+ transport system protein FeoA
VRRIPDGDAGLLRYLADLELVPGCRLVVRASDLPAGPITVDVAGRKHELSRELAGQIGVA